MPAWKWIMTTLFKTRTLLSLRKLGMLFGKPSNFTFVSSFWFIFLFLVFFFVQKLLIKRRKILKYIYHVIKNKKQKKMNFPEKVEQLAEKSGLDSLVARFARVLLVETSLMKSTPSPALRKKNSTNNGAFSSTLSTSSTTTRGLVVFAVLLPTL